MRIKATNLKRGQRQLKSKWKDTECREELNQYIEKHRFTVIESHFRKDLLSPKLYFILEIKKDDLQIYKKQYVKPPSDKEILLICRNFVREANLNNLDI